MNRKHWILLYAGTFVLLASTVYALNLSRVKTWGAEVLTHTDLNAEFDNILNHSIANADVSATAAIAGSKLDLSVPGAIGGTTPSTGAFTTLSATSSITAGTSAIPDAADGAAIGSTSAEWSDAYFADGAVINLGADQDVTLTHSADTGVVCNLDISGNTLTSTVATGTAPLTVASTTKVTNLNADTLDGYNSSTTSAATTIPVLDASGDLLMTMMPTEVAQVSQVTYTGNATDNRSITGVGFQPNYVLITPISPAESAVVKMSSMTGDSAKSLSTSSSATTDLIQAFESDGFQIGSSIIVNTNGGTYEATCMLTN